ncbi:MAG: gliding motility-associated C-terminal domain-containing protein [Bacteroidia bacterium]|nr:gliding motility-associated C-terminal domain-containing protein [Bacteroidia bacterium]NNC85522.1 gliding motility-associated C-terminal domain-containing protein [Bacteroidia bacterium]
MKRTGTLLVFLICCLVCTSSIAQTHQKTRKYRVIAYKDGDPTVYSVSNVAEVTPVMAMYVPNSFTPNGDGINDDFGVHGEGLKTFNMSIYNRWGQLIFESNSVNQKWDGTFDGSLVPNGSYVYHIVTSPVEGRTKVKKGSVLLYR